MRWRRAGVRGLGSVALAGLFFTMAGPGGAAGTADDTDVVIQVDEHGGFVPLEIVQGNVPEVTVYADGRVILEKEDGAFDRMTRLRVARINDARLDELIEMARSIGVLDAAEIDYGFPGVTDMTDTTVTVTVDGETYSTTVYALFFDSDDLTPEQQANRAALQSFISEVASATPRRAYHPTALAVLATHALDDRGDKVVEWPLDDIGDLGEPSRLGDRCLLVDGDDLDELLPLAKQARTAFRWASGDEHWRLVFRPLLPHERTCEDVGAV